MVDVLVVGAGPTGLTLACELIRHGLKVRVIDRLEEPVAYSKAAVVHARTMEIFDAMGIADDVLARTRRIHGINMYVAGKRVAHVGFTGAESPYPGVYGISQHETESLLTAHLRELGAVVERGCELLSFTQDDAGVHASTSHGPIDASYIAGCDGAHSTVRTALGFTFEGAPYEEKLTQADVHVTFAKEMPDDEICVYVGDSDQIALFPLFADGRYRFIKIRFDGQHTDEPTLEDFQAALDHMVPGAKVSDPAWITSFRIHHRHANHYRDRRAFILGDAGHIHSPAGGQGMNTGIHDAENLAWKLALVHRGKGKPVLLDSYEAERLPVARELLAGTDSLTRGMERIVSFRNPIATAIRDKVIGFVTSLQVVQATAQRRLSMLEIGYEKSPICGQNRASRFGSGGNPEAPRVLDWSAFGDAPAPGERAYPLPVFRDPKHVALLFDGGDATDEGYRNLAETGRAIRERVGGEVAIHLVLPRAERPEALQWDGSIMHDVSGEVHRRYGARSECLYLIRPDGHVAYRCQPIDRKLVLAYLDRVFV